MTRMTWNVGDGESIPGVEAEILTQASHYEIRGIGPSCKLKILFAPLKH